MNTKIQFNKKNLTHDFFLVSVFFKGLDGVLEIIGGVLLFLTDPAGINKLIKLLTQHELLEDKKDLIANYLVHAGSSLSLSTQHFGGYYLLSHGAIKVFLVASLLRRRLWAYPTAIVFFTAFVAYQLYRYAGTHSFFLLILTFIDLAVILFTWIEYKRLRKTRTHD